MAKAVKEIKQRDFRNEWKQLTDEGTFEGFASIYGNIDRVGDVVEKGAFTRTLNARPEVKILYRHDEVVGKGRIEDSDKGLIVKGQLTMAVARAREVLALMKDGVIDGLSIGYTTEHADVDSRGVRHLKEVKVYEVSLVPFAANEEAKVTMVKQAEPPQKKDFVQDLDRIQTDAGHYMMMNALDSALYDAKWGQGTAEERLAAATVSIDQFREAYLAWLPRYLEMRGVKEGAEREIKEGRKLSTETRTRLEAAMADHRAGMEKIQALLDAGSETKAAPGPATHGTDPVVDHSLLETLFKTIKGE